MTEKRVTPEVVEGALVALHACGGEMRSSVRPAPFVNLRIHVAGARAKRIGEELYAKVVEVDALREDRFRIRFTSISPPMAALLRELSARSSASP